MKKLSLTFLSILTILLCNNAYSQQADSLKQAKIKYISKDLSVTDSKAEEVVLIMDQYKADAKKLINDKNLTEDARRMKFDGLIDEKNSKLKKVLTEQQLEKMVPTTERHQNKTSTVINK